MSNRPKRIARSNKLLTEREMEFLGLLREDADTDIRDLYTAYYGDTPEARGHLSNRRQQQALSPVKFAVNSKIVGRGWVIKPGIARSSYRIYRTAV